MSKITSYSHYHPEALSMVGSPINQAVLLYLICRYQEKVKTGHKDQPFPISANKIAAEKNVSWRSVKQTLELFTARGVIDIDGTYCYFNESVYWKYLHKFQFLSYSDRAIFTAKFIDSKITNEEFDKYPEGDLENPEDFDGMRSYDVMQNVRGLCKMSEPYDKCHNPMTNVTTLCKMSEPYDISQNPMQNITTPELLELCKMLEGYAKCQNLMQNVRSACIKISCDASQNCSENELKELLAGKLDASYDISAITSDILHNPTEFTPEKLLFLAVLGSDICHNWLCKMSEGVMQNVTTGYAKCQNRYNINPNKKNNWLDEKNETDENEQSESEEEVFEGFEAFKVIELINPVEDNSQKGLRKPEPDYPFMPVEQVEEIVNNIEEAKQSSFRLFLFNLWRYASDMTNEGYDWYPDEENEQETFSATEEEFFDPEGCLITRSDYRQLLLESYEQTKADIEKGEMEYGEETLSLSLKEMFPRNLLFRILDWKETVINCKEASVIISKSGIRNIEAEGIASVEQPKTREEKRQAIKEGRGLMKRLYKAKQDNKLYSQLTTIEKIAADIVGEFFQPNPDKDEREPFAYRKGQMMAREDWRALQVKLAENNLKMQDFLSVLLYGDKNLDGEQLMLQNPMFYAEGIRHWNEVHQETSIVDSISVGE